jgi:lipoate-protein ligase A
MNPNWQLIIDQTPQRGSWNMAVDDFLFRSLGDDPATYLRFYRWEKPTVSIGRSQKIEEVVDMDFCRANGIDIVRRVTGGKLVLHHREVTYSICSSDTEIFSPKLVSSYRLISEALKQGLRKMGIESGLAKETPSSYSRGRLPCFSHPARDEIERQGKKIIGSAQKRTGKKFLQHGSIPLEKDESLLRYVSLLSEGKESIQMTSLSEALGRDVDFVWAVKHLTSGIAEYFAVQLVPESFSDSEKAAIRMIQVERYENPSWTQAY